VNCFRNSSGASGQAIRIAVSLSCVIPTVDSDVAALAGGGLALSIASRERAAIDRGKAAFQVHKIVGGDQNPGHSGMRLAVKGRDENPTSCSCCAIASRLAK
jgi:hypothetical protein